MLNKLAQQIHRIARDKGFYNSEVNIAEKLCLVHSEVSEALEADRTNKYAKKDILRINRISIENDFRRDFSDSIKNTFEDELADVMIRILDICALKGIDIESHIKAKMRYNSTRPYKHGKEY